MTGQRPSRTCPHGIISTFRGSRLAQMFINGERVSAASGATTEVRNPATREVVDTLPKGEATDTRRAIDAAAAAFPAWCITPSSKRYQILMHAIAHVHDHLH